MLTVEKIEGTIVTVEDDDTSFDTDISSFEGKIREGDVIIKNSDGRYSKDTKATEQRRKEILAMQNSLWN